MKKINVTSAQLRSIRDCLRDPQSSDGPYSKACEHGFTGFAGGIDHVIDRPWSTTLVDRGVNGAGGDYRDNSTKFVVQMSDRSGSAPLADYCAGPHGGKREGAGRKKGYMKPGARRYTTSVRLNNSELETARQIGDGVPARGMREALRLVAEDGRGKSR